MAIGELSNGEVCLGLTEQYFCPEVLKTTRKKMRSLGCIWDGVLTRKMQTLNIAKQSSLLGNPDSKTSRKQPNGCSGG